MLMVATTATGSFAGGVWSGQVTINQAAAGVAITAEDGAATGVSNAIDRSVALQHSGCAS